MNSVICLFACIAFASAGGLVGVHDDGQWRPWLDGSIHGASPGLATAALGAADVGVVGHGLVAGRALVAAPALVAGHGLLAGHGLVAGHGLLGGHLLAKRSLGAVAYGHGLVNPNALNVPLDTVHVAAAKNAQLIQQASEGARNILGGGVPLALPADTHEVAAGKVAHAIAHETQKAATASHHIGVAAAYAAPAAVVAPAVAPAAVVAPAVAAYAAPAVAAYAAPAVAAYAAPAVVAHRVVPATAVTHDAQVVASTGLGHGLLGHGLAYGHGLGYSHGFVARHW